MGGKFFPKGKALVIGGSGGVGAAICQRLAEDGCDVALTYRNNTERAKDLRESLSALGVKVSIHQVELSDSQSINATVKEVAETTPIHTVVVASGSDIGQPLIGELQDSEWTNVVDSDLNGFFRIIKATLPHLRRQGGSYVHISSAGLFRWPKRDVLSVAPKAAIESLIQGIAKEEGVNGVRANSVAIGVIETGIFKRLCADGTFDDEWQESVKSGLCLPQWGTADQVAEAVVYLASSRAAYTTGQVIAVDGGYGV